MKNLLIVFFLLATVSIGMADEKQNSVVFCVPGEGWFFTAFADGSVKGEYGSSFGDSIELPAKTIDFSQLVSFVLTSQTDTFGTETQAALRLKGENSTSMKSLREDSFFRVFFLKHRNDWKGLLGKPPSKRVQELMLKIRYYKATEPSVKD